MLKGNVLDPFDIVEEVGMDDAFDPIVDDGRLIALFPLLLPPASPNQLSIEGFSDFAADLALYGRQALSAIQLLDQQLPKNIRVILNFRLRRETMVQSNFEWTLLRRELDAEAQET